MGAIVQRSFGWRPPLYRPGTVCPGCGNQQWEVGRNVAECAVCKTAVPLAPETRRIGELS